MLTRLFAVAAVTLACSLAQAQPVVRVELFKGSPTVVKDGKTVPASYGLELSRKDQIVVPASSWLVLQILKNDFAVKIDEDLTLPVSDIALLDAPRQSKSFDDQLASMAKAKEIELNDRVTGYQNRRMAGTAGGGTKGGRAEPPAPADKEAPPPAPESAPLVQPSPPPPPSPAVANRPQAKPARAAPKGGGGSLEEKALEVDEAPRAKSDKKSAHVAPAFSWATVVGGRLTEEERPLAEAIVEAIRKAKVERCIQDAFKAAKVELPKVDHLLLRKVDGKVQVKLASRLELALACAQAFDGVAEALPEKGWVRVEIRLSK